MNKHVSDWFKISKRDLLGAEFNLSGPDDLLAFVGYLAQQSAEKSIKGFLTFHNKRITKTHNISELMEKVREIDLKLVESISAASTLTVFALNYRYPEIIEKKLTRKDVEDAIVIAKLVLLEVLQSIESQK